jgi:hypothetical protein
MSSCGCSLEGKEDPCVLPAIPPVDTLVVVGVHAPPFVYVDAESGDLLKGE